MASISYGAVWEALAAEWEVRLSDSVIRRHTPVPATSLVQCRSCGLQFFLPPAPGDADFYRELGASPKYYVPWKWEFGWVLERLRPADVVLDVGCGRGDFLAEARKIVRRAVGLEINPDAAATAAARGIEVVRADIADFASANAGRFDAACAFHLVEHLADPVPMLRALVSCLRPGGGLFVSVPNRMRSARDALEPLDCPPHHLSRWSPDQLRTLGRVLGIGVRQLACEPVAVGVPREKAREAVKRIFAALPAGGEFFGVWAGRAVVRLLFNAPLSGLCSRSGLFERLGYYGHAAVAWFEAAGP